MSFYFAKSSPWLPLDTSVFSRDVSGLKTSAVSTFIPPRYRRLDVDSKLQAQFCRPIRPYRAISTEG